MDGDPQAEGPEPGPDPDAGGGDGGLGGGLGGDAKKDTAHGDQDEQRDEQQSSSRWLIELVGVVLVAVLVAFLLRTFVVATYSIPSGSMEPTLKIGDRIVVNKLSYHLHGVDRGNIVVFSTPPAENCAGPPVSDLVKRVIGLPGEIITLNDGHVLINGHILAEPYLPPSARDDTYPGPGNAGYSLHHAFRIPAGDVYVMGDNRTESCDSRYWGPIAKSTIVGKVDMRIWPLARLGFF
jgi:signal peptidase I